MLWAYSRVPSRPCRAADLDQLQGEERRQRVARFQHSEHRWQRILADQLLRQLCANGGLPEHSYLPTGQPTVAGSYLSVSHDGDLVVAALSADPIGIDVVDLVRCAGLSPTPFLSEAELDSCVVLHGDAMARALFFARCWAAKEAVLKQRGCGLTVDPRTLTVVSREPRCAVAGIAPCPIPVRLFPFGSRHRLALAGADSPLPAPSPIPPPRKQGND